LRRLFLSHWKYLPPLFALLVTACTVIISCKPGVRITSIPRWHRTLATARPVEEIPPPAQPRIYRPEKDRKYRYHKEEWLIGHKTSGKANPGDCVSCHMPESCVACHEAQLPDSHRTSQWVITHSKVSSISGEECLNCHKEKYCLACHKVSKPSSHTSLWLKRHGKESQAAHTSCQMCHPNAFCSACHGVPMPHPEDWRLAHAGAKQATKVCERCHQQLYCRSCHQTTKPSSHSTSWQKEHGKVVVKEKRDCSTCHSDKYCLDCHGGIPMPHPSGFVVQHKQHGASLSEGSPCFRCHERKYCQMCHPGR